MSYENYPQPTDPYENTAHVPLVAPKPLGDTAEMPIPDFGLTGASRYKDDTYRPLNAAERKIAQRRTRTPIVIIAGIATACFGLLAVDLAMEKMGSAPSNSESPAAIAPLLPSISASPDASPSQSQSQSPSPTPSKSPRHKPSHSASPVISLSASPSPSILPSPSVSLSPSYIPTFSPTPTPSPDISATSSEPSSSYACYPTPKRRTNAYCNDAPAYNTPEIASNPAVLLGGPVEFPANCHSQAGSGGMSFDEIFIGGVGKFIPSDDVDPILCA